ncbi:MAG TPA: response regulator [Candidatus Brocadiia bacterium]|nr:response regulator [Candidatus Brocadiia bacterium]
MNAHIHKPERRLCILVSDRDEESRGRIVSALEAGYLKALEAPTEQEALMITKSEHCDLLIADMQISADDGIEMLMDAWKLCQPSAPAILTSWERGLSVRRWALAHDAFAFLPKPLREGSVKLAVGKALCRWNSFDLSDAGTFSGQGAS